ncbi:PIR Superfamily Protein [Plasmodium ovale curtisi]|uniref:PIR Superfamily Protein n=1 Tax=Plasmodium ovale curtisi TaxID=864141 RepID=A0A1A8WX24_PLAOA|nr:PIR Superfamily Protein [Plasmodium ovale curtisi]
MAAAQHHRNLGRLFGYTATDLFSEQFYQDRELDQLDLHEYSALCKNLYTPKHRSSMMNLCKRIVKYLDKYSSTNDDNSVNQDCILLNYWVYDKLSYILGVDNTEDIKIYFGFLQNIWSNLVTDTTKTSYYKKCKDNFGILYHDDWKQRKALYEYIVDYTTLYETARSYKDKKCKEYYKKIEEKQPLYDYFQKECASDDYICPDSYKNHMHYNPQLVLSNLPCHDEMVAAKQKLPMQEDLRQKHQSVSRARGSDTVSTQENSGIGTKVGHSVLGVAPVLLTATALYRYTPVGSWIRKFGGLQNNISDMDGGEIDGFLSHTQVSDDMFLSNTENYISYQPM